MAKKLICLVGLPYSGKTTYAQTLHVPMVNPDSIRLELHGQRFVPKAEEIVWAITKLMVRSLFRAGHDTVVLDATNVTKKRRARWIDSEWETEFHVIPTNRAVCESRAIGDADILPIIERMANEYEPLSQDEGVIVNVAVQPK